MSECTHNCSTCSANCGSRDKQSMYEAPHPATNVKHIIGVVSGKGGVGKSLVTSMLASAMQARGNACAVLDADITGPSIPKAFGITEKASANEIGIFPLLTSTGIGTMSVNNLLENDTDPVVWRGPVIAGTVKQFWTDVLWGDVDYMFVDMPPGTGDVPLTVFQSLPIDGIVINYKNGEFEFITPYICVNSSFNPKTVAELLNTRVHGFDATQFANLIDNIDKYALELPTDSFDKIEEGLDKIPEGVIPEN